MSANERIGELIEELRSAHEPLQARIRELEEAIRQHRDADIPNRVLANAQLYQVLHEDDVPLKDKLPHWSDYLIECTRFYLTLQGEIKPIQQLAQPTIAAPVLPAGVSPNPVQQSHDEFMKQQLAKMPPHMRQKAEAAQQGRCTECGHKDHKGRLCENFQPPPGQRPCDCNDIPIRGWGALGPAV